MPVTYKDPVGGVWEVKWEINSPIFRLFRNGELLITFPTRLEFYDFINFLEKRV